MWYIVQARTVAKNLIGPKSVPSIGMLQTPEITKDGLRYLSVCIHVDLPSKSAACEDVEVQSKVGDDSYLRKIVDTHEDYCHFHIEVGMKRELARLGKVTKQAGARKVPTEIVGQRTYATIWGRFRLNISKLPLDSFIRTLSGVVIPAKDYELSISGGTLDVRGDGPIIELRWTSVTDEVLKIDLGAYAELTIDDDLLINAAPILKNGLEQLVLRKKAPKKLPKKGPPRGKGKSTN